MLLYNLLVMKVLLSGKRSDRIKQLVTSMGFEIVKKNPQVVITYGGDGTLLSAESLFPSIPKLAIRDNAICVKCQNHKDEKVLTGLQKDKLKLFEINKLEAHFQDKKQFAVNDFVIRNSLQMHAIRFKINSSDELIIGDGVVVATSFGSSGYFKSITRKTFTKGFGLAFNNTTEPFKPIYFNQDTIKVTIVRGPATLTSDNSPDTLELTGGCEITFKPSSQKLRIYDSSLKCPNCKLVRNH